MATLHDHADGRDCDGLPLAPGESCAKPARDELHRCGQCGCWTFAQLCTVCARRAARTS